jgi:phosphatidylglycerophosphatase A
MQFILLLLASIMSGKMGFKNKLLLLVGNLFFVGRIRGGGTLASLLTFLFILTYDSIYVVLSIFLLSLLVYKPSLRMILSLEDDKDPKQYVLDEIIGLSFGILLTEIFILLFQSSTSNLFDIYDRSLVLGIIFIFFRLFDIFKPVPVKWIDQPKSVPESIKNLSIFKEERALFRVIADDLVAGFMAFLVLVLISLYLVIG